MKELRIRQEKLSPRIDMEQLRIWQAEIKIRQERLKVMVEEIMNKMEESRIKKQQHTGEAAD